MALIMVLIKGTMLKTVPVSPTNIPGINGGYDCKILSPIGFIVWLIQYNASILFDNHKSCKATLRALLSIIRYHFLSSFFLFFFLI